MADIEHLVIISGPSRSGKSHLIDRLHEAQNTALGQQLNISNPNNYVCLSVLQLQRLNSKPPAHIILHYDLCYQWEQDNFAYLEELIDRTLVTTVVTLQTPIKVLRSRNLVRLRKQLYIIVVGAWNRAALRHLGYLWRLHRLYGTPKQLQGLYEHWQHRIAHHTIAQRWWLDTESQRLQTEAASGS